MAHVKTCTSCLIEKPLDAFGVEKHGRFGRRSACRECRSANEKRPEYYRAYYQRNRVARLAQMAEYRSSRREELNAKQLARYYADKPNVLAKMRVYLRERKRRDSKLRLKSAIATKVWFDLKRRKQGRAFDLLGYSLGDLMRHLESRFAQGMTWDNYGEWHVDHIQPVSSFVFTKASDDGFKACWALHNLQPLWAADNLRKGARTA